MDFEWDEIKAAANERKHGLTFEEAIRIFENFVYSRSDHRKDYGEKRTINLGRLSNRFIVAVVTTERDNVTRVISARPMSRRERAIYEEET